MRAGEVKVGDEFVFYGEKIVVLEKNQPVLSWRGKLRHRAGLKIQLPSGDEQVIEAAGLGPRWLDWELQQESAARRRGLAEQLNHRLGEGGRVSPGSLRGYGGNLPITLHLTEEGAQQLLELLGEGGLSARRADEEKGSALHSLLGPE